MSDETSKGSAVPATVAIPDEEFAALCRLLEHEESNLSQREKEVATAKAALDQLLWLRDNVLHPVRALRTQVAIQRILRDESL